MPIGSEIGGLLGGIIGSAVAPGAGTAAGSAIGSGVGDIATSLLSKKPQAPPAVDPQQEAYNAQLDMLRKNRGTGVAYQEALRQLRIGQADTLKQIMNQSGGNSGAAIAGMTALNNEFGNQYGKIFSAGEQAGNFTDTLYDKNLNNAIDTNASVNAMQYGQDILNKANLNKSADSNINAGVASGLPISGNGISGLLSKLFGGGGSAGAGAIGAGGAGAGGAGAVAGGISTAIPADILPLLAI